eukprot:7161462-Prorocentrum_lima.AAC.1
MVSQVVLAGDMAANAASVGANKVNGPGAAKTAPIEPIASMAALKAPSDPSSSTAPARFGGAST